MRQIYGTDRYTDTHKKNLHTNISVRDRKFILANGLLEERIEQRRVKCTWAVRSFAMILILLVLYVSTVIAASDAVAGVC